MAGNTLRATVELDDGGVTKKLKGISDAFDKVGGKGSGASFFGNVGAKAVAKGFDLIGASIGGVTDFLKEAFDAAVEDQASQEKLGVALKNNIPNWDGNTDALNKYIDAQLKHGFADDEVRDSLGQLVGITHDAQKATELNTIAQDLARAKGIDLGTATDIVTKAAQGNGKALKALGIDTTGAKDATALLNDIVKNTKGSMDAYDNTMAGKVNVSQLEYNEAMEKIGYQIMPVVADLMKKFAEDWLPALGRGWQKVMDAIKPVLVILGKVIDALKSAIGFVGDLIHAIDNLPGVGDLPKYGPYAGHAEGGWVGLNGPEMAIVGERGPEYIIPNRDLAGRHGTQGTTGHGHAVYMDGKKVADLVSTRHWYKQRRAAITNSKV